VPILFQIESEQALHGVYMRRILPIYAAYAVLQSHAVRALATGQGWHSAYPGAVFFFEPSCIELLDPVRQPLDHSRFMELGLSEHDLEAWDGLT
jgi:hypothetical protein